MAIVPGRELLHFRLVERIGEGGMGVVWKAVDTTLEREVAIKVLPDAFAASPERLARFEREAKFLAALSHPNIATIHGLHESEGVRFLSMEMLPGEDLARRLSRGPLPVEEAIGVARQVAAALEAAHDGGVLHRDLKPANVHLEPDGSVKVLDLGLAKALEPAPTSEPPDLSRSPTRTSGGTLAGMVLGTAAYMSPEQARGKPVDRRADVWAFGCLLYEMLTGRPLFSGETVSDVLAAVLRAPLDLGAIPPETPAAARRLLRRCLERDPARRLRDFGDIRLEIEEAIAAPEPETQTPTAPGRRGRRALLPWALVAAMTPVVVVAVWTAARRDGASMKAEVGRFEIVLPDEVELHRSSGPAVAWTPDGSRLVFSARQAGEFNLYARARDRAAPEKIPGTEGAYQFAVSPDGQWVAFAAGGQLRKVPLAGGVPVALCGVRDPSGITWGDGGTIVFNAEWGEGLSRVDAGGGMPRALTTLDHADGEGSHVWPRALPGGDGVLFTVFRAGGFDEARIAVVSLETGRRRTLVHGGLQASYSPTGHLLYLRQTSLMAAPFDLERIELSGPELALVEGVRVEAANFSAHYDLSSDGALACLTGGVGPEEEELVWVDRAGKASPAVQDRRAFGRPRLSPDGRRLAVIVEGPTFHVWVYDLLAGTKARLTAAGDNLDPVWSPDGRRMVFTSNLAGPYGLFWQMADGSRPPEPLGSTRPLPTASSFAPDGSVLAFHAGQAETNSDIWILDVARGEAKPFRGTQAKEIAAAFSPDGKWLAYVSDESGRSEVHVAPFPGPGAAWQISTGGGDEPVWSPQGRELFYTWERKMFAVDVDTSSGFKAAAPRVLFEGEFESDYRGMPAYAVSLDGRRFLMIRDVGEARRVGPIHVVLNWTEELRRRVPPR